MIDDVGRLDIHGEVAAHIRPRTKRLLTRPGQDDTAVAGALERVPPAGQLCQHGTRHRIAAGLMIDGHQHDVATLFLHVDGHGTPPDRLVLRPGGSRLAPGHAATPQSAPPPDVMVTGSGDSG